MDNWKPVSVDEYRKPPRGFSPWIIVAVVVVTVVAALWAVALKLLSFAESLIFSV
jgi:hypothetical protein